MTKTERIRLLEKLVAELSYRVYQLEINRYRPGPVYTPSPYWYYSSHGTTTRLGNVSSHSSGLSDQPTTGGFSFRGNEAGATVASSSHAPDGNNDDRSSVSSD